MHDFRFNFKWEESLSLSISLPRDYDARMQLVDKVKQCHGATTMTDSECLIDESSNKSNMWGGFRCNKSFLILLLVNVIVFQTILCEYSSSSRAIVIYNTMSPTFNACRSTNDENWWTRLYDGEFSASFEWWALCFI